MALAKCLAPERQSDSTARGPRRRCTLDLMVGKGPDNAVLVVPGGPQGLDYTRRTKISLDYRIQYETGLFVGDFNSDGKPDLACLGYTNTGVGAGGPLAAYISTCSNADLAQLDETAFGRRRQQGFNPRRNRTSASRPGSAVGWQLGRASR